MSLIGRAAAASHLKCVAPAIRTGVGQSEPASLRLKFARPFDRMLSGGLADDGLHEIVPRAAADGPAAISFALALAARFLAQKSSPALLIADGFAIEELGAFYGPGLVAHGLPLGRLVFVKAPDAGAALWAVEEAVKSSASAVVIGEVWSLKGYGLATSRRLLLAARQGRTPTLLVLASAYGHAESLSTAAETRFEISAAPSAKIPAAGGKGLPGRFTCGVRLLKARSAFPGKTISEAVDPTRIHRLEWRSEERTFDDPALSLTLAASAGDRPRSAAQSN